MKRLFVPALFVVAAAAIVLLGFFFTAAEPPQPKKPPDAPFVPTPQPVVDLMLDVAEVKPGDVVYDLGCGDGIIVVSAAKRGARAVGFDIDPVRVRETQANIDRNGVGDLAEVFEKDIFTLDLGGASVITLFLLWSTNERLIPQLEKLKPGTRIVAHNFNIRGIKPEKVVPLRLPNSEHKVYLYRAPLERENPAP